MTTVSDRIIDAFGGSTALSQKSKIPLSTVHSWRSNGIPRGRQGHLDLLAESEGLVIEWETGLVTVKGGADHADSDTTRAVATSPGIGGQFSPSEPAHV